ncbi:uncharacterized protein ARMOST_11424 [Armillaria ostoyae]|uniref:Uncharacterized protein n=1 Tax=Armillaria ostoyae TaxID=47428 RepID=A0A284RH36_ARMOS|nr:uncharacterized protein ARMOST_11424 [Armillaria ostoyae]
MGNGLEEFASKDGFPTRNKDRRTRPFLPPADGTSAWVRFTAVIFSDGDYSNNLCTTKTVQRTILEGRKVVMRVYGILVIASPSTDNIHSPNFAPKTQGTTVNNNAGMSQKSLETGWEDHRWPRSEPHPSASAFTSPS